MPREGINYFGIGGNWRHSWQYDLIPLNAGAKPRPAMVLVYPSGEQRLFEQAASGQWAPLTRFHEKAAATSDGFEITTFDGNRLKFVSNIAAGTKRVYVMRTLTDNFGLATALGYNARGDLTQVTEPSGRQLKVTYKDQSFQSGRWKELGTVKTAPSSGQWLEMAVPEALQTVSFQYVRLLAPNGKPLVVAEAQFFVAGSSTPLTGTASGTGELPQTAFDGNTTTVFRGLRGSTNLASFDFGASNPRKIARVRVLAAQGQEAVLTNVVVQGLVTAPEVWPVITQVTGSDGRSVNYDYELLSDPFTAQEHITLSRARYSDGTTAGYRYTYATPGQRPLLSDADDPRYEGRAKRIRYAYQDNDQLGMIHQEINPATGGVYASLELDPRDPLARTVRYSDLKEIKYRVAADRPVIEQRTDSLGHTTRAERDASGRITALVDHTGRREQKTYDAHGRIQTSDRQGRLQKQRDRDGNDRITREVDRTGRETRYERDGNGRVTRMTRGTDEVREFGHDALGRITSFRSSKGGLHQFTYNSQGLKASWTDPVGNTARYGYDANGRLTAITDPLGRVSTFERNERGLATKITAFDGTAKQFAYDSYGRKVAQTDEHGRTSKFTYDELGRVIRQEDHAGRVTTFDFTELPQGCGSCTLVPQPSRIVHPDGSVEKLLYDTEGQLIARTVAAATSAQATALYGYDADNNPVSTTDPLGRVTRFTYDDEHHRLSQTDPLGRVTKWTYDDDGNVLTTTAPDGGVTKMTYDNFKHLLSTTDAAGNTTRTTYDANGRVTSITDAHRDTTRFLYDDGGRKIATIYADAKRQTWAYDNAGRVNKTVSPDGVVATTTYDAGNRPLKIARVIPNAPSETATFTYDALGHRLTATDPLGRTTKWTYDARGNILTVMRPDGIVATRNTYDAQDNLLATTDAAGATTTFTYDVARNQTSLTDAKGNTYRFTYDALRRKTSMTYPDGSTETWGYDLAGSPTTFINRAGQTKVVAYNAGNQPVAEAWSNPSSSTTGAAPALLLPTAYTYDSAGRLKLVDNGNAKLAYTYDKLGRLDSETSDLSALVPGLDDHTVKYAYDELGRRSDLIYPDRTKVSYDYDVRGRLTTIDSSGGGGTPSSRNGTPLATYGYNAKGQIAKLTRDNGVATTYTYDMAGQLTDVTHANGGTVLASSRYTLDILGRRTAQTRDDGITETYGYDATSQLTSADYGTAPAKRETFAYDPVGNRTQVGRVIPNAPSTTTNYTTNALNQYTQIDQTASGLTPQASRLVYDTNGNLTNDGKQLYGYDAQNRLVAVESTPVGGALRPDSVRAEFFYDARNRCVLRKYYTLGGTGQWVLNTADSRALTYDTAWNLLAERQLSGTQSGEYIHGQRTDEILAADFKSAMIYPLADGLGSTVSLADDKGRITERVRYDVYGQPRFLSATHQSQATSLTGYRFLFTGREWLTTVGLNDHRNRYYSQNLGRWPTTDPIRFLAGDINLYAYVNNRPIQFSDSTGLICINKLPIPCLAYGDLCVIACAAQGKFGNPKCYASVDGFDIHVTVECTCTDIDPVFLVLGAVVIIGGVAFLVTTGGSGAIVLVPVLVAAGAG